MTSSLAALALALVAGCGAPSVAAHPATPTALTAVDIFDTDPADIADATARHGDALRALLRDSSDARVHALVEALRADGAYAYVAPSRTTYFQPSASYLTIDLVAKRDAARRMPFGAAPTRHHPDPEGLIAAWRAYEAKVHELQDRGELRTDAACPAFHCMGDPRHHELAPLAATLPAADRHLDELAVIARDDRDPERRAAAVFLLAYGHDGAAVVAAVLPAIRDPSQLVRNSAMRVIALIARDHPEIEVPLTPVLEALQFPATTDRNKAAATLAFLMKRPDAAANHARVAREAGPVLLAMLALQQPNNHDFAYQILKSISGESFGERDLAAWRAWVSRATS